MADTVAALDADVLVPILACDFLLTAFDHGLYEPVVSAIVLDEVLRTLTEDFPGLEPAAVSYRVDAMRDVLQDNTGITAPANGTAQLPEPRRLAIEWRNVA